MPEQSQQNLESLVQEDPVSRPLASVQLEALQASSDPDWERAATRLTDASLRSHTPALHGQRITFNPRAVTRLVNNLSRALATPGDIDPGLVPRHIPEAAAGTLLKAAIEGDADALTEIADETGADPAVIATLAQYTALPLLLACGERLMPGGSGLAWESGYCPICGSWPALAELRGLERRQWLRCNRCAAAWQSRHQRCVFCDNTDHQTLGYMAPEAERESRRAITCDACKGYLKAFATVSPPGIADLLRMDLQSLELDIAATDSGYARPQRPGFSLNIELVPVNDGLRRWLPWQ